MLSSSIFRAYDIRGIVNQTLTPETVFLIGMAIGSLIREQNKKEILIARDGRSSGPVLSNALCEGLLATGCDVIDLGMIPTPVLYYATHLLTPYGVMMTGSHNPANYNGLKLVIDGAPLTEQGIQNLYQRIVQQQFCKGHGVKRELNITEQYIDEITKQIHLARPLKIVIDAGNGVTGMLAPTLFKALGCEVHELYCEVDGQFPNHHPDPSQTENLQDLIRTVKTVNADIGLAFDGDGDRLGIVTNTGEIIWPDRLLMLFAKSILLSTHPNAKIIYDVKCTNHLEHLIHSHGGEALMWKTGHSFIKTKMIETKAQLAGEMSGHFFFKDRWFGFDDALYAGARLLEILAQHQEQSSVLFSAIPNSVNTPELKISIPEEEKFSLMQQLIANASFANAKDVITIDGLRVNFFDGWGLVRPSNTTPFLILRFEAINQVILEKIQNLFREWMLSVKPDLVLPF